MELKDEFTMKDVGEVASFNGSTYRPYGRVMLENALHDKAGSIDFYFKNYNTLHNGLIGRDWMGKMGTMPSLLCQCLKFPIGDMICKGHTNQWKAFKCKEESFH